MPSLKQVREAAATILRAALDDTAVYSRLPAQANVPAVLILPADADYLVVHRNAGTGWEFDLIVLVPSGDEDVAQNILDDYVDARGDKSIAAAIHANSNLGRSDCSAVVRRMSNYGMKYKVGTDEHIGATLRLSVVVSHS